MNISRIIFAITLMLGIVFAQERPPIEKMRLESVSQHQAGMLGTYVDENDNRFLIYESKVGEAEVKRMREMLKPIQPVTPVIDAAIAKLRKGEALLAEEVKQCEDEKGVYYAKLLEKYPINDNTKFGPSDKFQYYTVMIRMAMIDPKNHGGWPLRSTLREMVWKDYRKLTVDSKDPFVHFCAIFPFLSHGKLELAIPSAKFVQQNDPFLFEMTLAWAGKLPESDIKTKFMDALQTK